MGVTVHVTALKIDPRFSGHITLEMANFGKASASLRAGIDKPAQLLLARVTSPLEASDLYGADAEDIFSNQKKPIPGKKKRIIFEREELVAPSLAGRMLEVQPDTEHATSPREWLHFTPTAATPKKIQPLTAKRRQCRRGGSPPRRSRAAPLRRRYLIPHPETRA